MTPEQRQEKLNELQVLKAKRDELVSKRQGDGKDGFTPQPRDFNADYAKALRLDPALADRLLQKRQSEQVDDPTKTEIRRLEQLLKDYTREIDGMRRMRVDSNSPAFREVEVRRQRVLTMLNQFDPVLYPLEGESTTDKPTETPTATQTSNEIAPLDQIDSIFTNPDSFKWSDEGVMTNKPQIIRQIRALLEKQFPGEGVNNQARLDIYKSDLDQEENTREKMLSGERGTKTFTTQLAASQQGLDRGKIDIAQKTAPYTAALANLDTPTPTAPAIYGALRALALDESGRMASQDQFMAIMAPYLNEKDYNKLRAAGTSVINELTRKIAGGTFDQALFDSYLTKVDVDKLKRDLQKRTGAKDEPIQPKTDTIIRKPAPVANQVKIIGDWK